VADHAHHARGTRRGLSQNFLRSRRLAEDIVRGLDVRPHELIVEIGAGDGRLTEPLARQARRLIAIELDPRLAARLRARFEVVERDALSVALPDEPFRVVGNLPFHRTTAILRRILDDPAAPLTRADLIVQLGFALKRAAVVPTTQLAAEWGPAVAKNPFLSFRFAGGKPGDKVVITWTDNHGDKRSDEATIAA
jgi:23S rRNA (adenine-N6)-dimethyltransferase